MSEPEGENLSNLKTVINRICLGIGFGSIFLSFVFSIWAIATNGTGPIIGVMIFDVISMLMIGYIIGVGIYYKRYNDFDRV